MELKIPPPVYGLLFATLMWLLTNHFPIVSLDFIGIENFALIFISIGVAIDLSSLAIFFISKTTINPLKPENANHLVTSGMYRYSRNPMYLGLLFLLTGWSLFLGTLSALLLLPMFIWVLTLMQIQPEERILTELFGEAYLNYKQQVRRWI